MSDPIDELVKAADTFTSRTPPAAEWRQHVRSDDYQRLCGATINALEHRRMQKHTDAESMQEHTYAWHDWKKQAEQTNARVMRLETEMEERRKSQLQLMEQIRELADSESTAQAQRTKYQRALESIAGMLTTEEAGLDELSLKDDREALDSVIVQARKTLGGKWLS